MTANEDTKLCISSELERPWTELCPAIVPQLPKVGGRILVWLVLDQKTRHRSFLGRNATVDPLVERAARRANGEVRFVLPEQFLLPLSNRKIVNILHLQRVG